MSLENNLKTSQRSYDLFDNWAMIFSQDAQNFNNIEKSENVEVLKTKENFKENWETNEFPDNTNEDPCLTRKIDKNLNVEMNHQKEKLIHIHQKAGKKNFNKSLLPAKNGIKHKRRRRKNITPRRNQYKQRKDVVLKSILRRCRKFFQDKYANFTRIQFLESPTNSLFAENPDIFPNELSHDCSQKFTMESLKMFSECEFNTDHGFKNLSLYIGKVTIKNISKFYNFRLPY